MDAALFTLLHVLVFVYWLGGDLGAFYGSVILGDARQPPAARMAAAKIVLNVDMAPRSALILTLPTGLTLADQRGWLDLSAPAILLAWGLGLAWLVIAWTIHLRHLRPASTMRRADLVIRWLVLVVAGAAGVAVLARLAPLPLFLGLKLVLFAGTVALGLTVRRLLAPFGPALGQLAGGAPTPEADALIARSLGRVRPAVAAIWVLLVAAALLGLWRPQ